jgi:hypothetical protein
MMNRAHFGSRFGLLVLAAGTLLPGLAAADDPATITTANSSPWQFSPTLYLWLPKISGTINMPITGTQRSATLDQSDILNHLNIGAMGSFDVHYRQFGVFVDAIYISLGANNAHYRNLNVGGVPVTTDSYLNLHVKVDIVTYALEYRFADTPLVTMDVLAGARYFYLKNELGYVITGAIDGLPPRTRTGNPSVSNNRTDPIGGFKGIFHLDSSWDLPAYFDIGGDMTYQVAGGAAYKLKYGEVSALYRYLNYYVGHSGGGTLTVHGPMVGWTMRW